MSFRNLSMLPGGAMVEAVTQFTVSDDVAKNAIDNPPLDYFTPLRKVSETIRPIHDEVKDLLNHVSLEFSDTAIYDLDRIYKLAKTVAETLPVVFAKSAATNDLFSRREFTFQPLYANLKTFILRKAEIVKSGLSNISVDGEIRFPVLSNHQLCFMMNQMIDVFNHGTNTIISFDSIKNVMDYYDRNQFEYFDSIDDLIDCVNSMDDRFNRLTTTSNRTIDVCSFISDVISNSRDHYSSDEACRSTTYLKYCNNMLRFVSETRYSLLMAIDDKTVDNKYYREAVMQIIASVCNTFYIGSMYSLHFAFLASCNIHTKAEMDSKVKEILATIK